MTARDVNHDWSRSTAKNHPDDEAVGAAHRERQLRTMGRVGPATFRKEWSGGGHGYTLDGVKCPGVTTIIGNGLPKPALVNWAARAAAEYAADNLPTLATLDREAIVELVKGAPNRDRDKAARRGTEVHTLAQRLQAGEEVDVPPELEGHVDSYIAFVEEWQPTDMLVERIIINRKYRYMGTLDAIATLPGLGRCLFDLKTNRSGVFGDVALQIAGYRYAETMLTPDNRGEEPMPEVDWTGVLHIRADGFDLFPVQAGPAEFRSLLYVQQVGQFLTASKDLVGSPVYPLD